MVEVEYQSTDLRGLLGRPLNDVEEKYAPPTIYFKGAIDVPLPCPRVSVIGTREPTEEGLKAAEDIATTLVKNNVVIVSGLAKGIDTMGHKTAIKNGGKTIAVLGTPLNKAYPKENTELQDEMMKNQLVVSQYSVGRPTTKKDFALRNRTMALISDASVIVEARDGSGTLYQGWETIRLGRPLYICKSVVQNSNLEWPKEMIEYGAMKLDDPEDILEILPSNVQMPELFQK